MNTETIVLLEVERREPIRGILTHRPGKTHPALETKPHPGLPLTPKSWKDYECEEVSSPSSKFEPYTDFVRASDKGFESSELTLTVLEGEEPILSPTKDTPPLDVFYNPPVNNLCQYYNANTCTHIGDGTALACVAYMLGELLRRTPSQIKEKLNSITVTANPVDNAGKARHNNIADRLNNLNTGWRS